MLNDPKGVLWSVDEKSEFQKKKISSFFIRIVIFFLFLKLKIEKNVDESLETLRRDLEQHHPSGMQ